VTLLTDFRLAVTEAVQQVTGIEVLPGRFDGPVAETDLGCAYPVRQEERSSNVTEQELSVRVRLFVVPNPEPGHPPDPARLEELVQIVQEALDDDQDLGGVWFFRLTEAEYDLRQFGVEMQFNAIADNAFDAGA